MPALLKVGLVGWACRTGLGQLNLDLARLAPWVTAWLVPEHPQLGVDAALLVAGKSRPCRAEGDDAIYERFLDDVDAVLFVERQYVRDGFDLLEAARARGRIVCAIPMIEFLRDDEPWLSRADLVWAPTRWSAVEMHGLAQRRAAAEGSTGGRHFHSPWADAVIGGRLGVDTELFAFRPRARARRLLFVNGRGGYRGRKGADLLARAAEQAPEVPLRVLSQVELPTFPAHVEILREDRPDRVSLYEKGDVLVAPSRWEGFGHSLYEAQACGLPVLTTDAAPMRECGGEPIRVARTRRLLAGRNIVSHEICTEALARAMRAIHGRDLATTSRSVRGRMEREHDMRQVLEDLGAAIEARVGGWKLPTAALAPQDGRAAAASSSRER